MVDCGVTGSLSGNTAGWTEVTKSIYPMSLGWSINVLAVNLDSWKRLDPKTQAFLLDQFKAYEDKMWATIKTTTGEAENCNTGKQPCTMGKLAKTTIVPVKPEEAERTRSWSRARCWPAGPSAAAPNAPRSGTTPSASRSASRRRRLSDASGGLQRSALRHRPRARLEAGGDA